MTERPIELEIEELALENVDPGAGPLIADEVGRQLGARFATEGIRHPDSLGATLDQAIHNGLSQ